MTDQHRLARAITVVSVWMEDSNFFDGNALYLDLDTAKAHAAYDYEGYEYGRPGEDDDEDVARPDFTWEESHGQWTLLDHGRDTHVRVAECTVWRPATAREVEQQDALTAVEEAERASRPQQSLREAFEALSA